MKDLFGNEVKPGQETPRGRYRNKSGGWKVNPMRLKLGAGPDDKRCKHCAHFIRKEYAKTYFKCAFRGDTNGPGTDHRANWPTCVKFEEEAKLFHELRNEGHNGKVVIPIDGSGLNNLIAKAKSDTYAKYQVSSNPIPKNEI